MEVGLKKILFFLLLFLCLNMTNTITVSSIEVTNEDHLINLQQLNLERPIPQHLDRNEYLVSNPSFFKLNFVANPYSSGLLSLNPDTGIVKNANCSLNISTYDGSGEVVHPDIIYFKDGWNGYKYWQVMTPYYHLNDSYENPSLIASNDGSNWVAPYKIINPIVPKPKKGYNADPDLIYNSATNELWLYYNSYNDVYTNYSMIKVNNNLSVLSPKVLYSSPTNVDERQRSLSVVKVNSSYYIWVQNNSAPNRVQFMTSLDGENFSKPLNVFLFGSTPWMKDDLWHINVEYISSLDSFLMIMNSLGNKSGLYLGITDAENPTSFYFCYQPLLLPSRAGWDNQLIYRSSTLTNEENYTTTIWYSAFGYDGEYHSKEGQVSVDLLSVYEKIKISYKLELLKNLSNRSDLKI